MNAKEKEKNEKGRGSNTPYSRLGRGKIDMCKKLDVVITRTYEQTCP